MLLAAPAHAADLDCPDFPSQAAAQAAYAADPSDPHRLDRDHDGQACEDHVYGAGGTIADRPASTSTQVRRVPRGAVAAGDGSAAERAELSSELSVGLLVGAAGAAVVGAAGAVAAGRVRRTRTGRSTLQ